MWKSVPSLTCQRVCIAENTDPHTVSKCQAQLSYGGGGGGCLCSELSFEPRHSSGGRLSPSE